MEKNFSDRCYELLRMVPRGYVVTYKQIANKLNSRAYRAVGLAMKNNPNIPQTPCHRVVNSNGKLGGYLYGLDAKIELLKKEGIEIRDGKVVDFDKRNFKFD